MTIDRDLQTLFARKKCLNFNNGKRVVKQSYKHSKKLEHSKT